MESVSKAAYKMIEEVRRQFREKFLASWKVKRKPDYTIMRSNLYTGSSSRNASSWCYGSRCTSIIIGIVLGTEALGGLLAGALVTGVMMAIFMSNAGGAWDNAKKYIETGHHGGKGS